MTLTLHRNESEWLAHRQTKLTSSDIPPLLGVYPSEASKKYRNPYEIWRVKTGKADPPEVGGMRLRFDLGHLVEDRVAQEVEKKEGLKLVDLGSWTTAERGFISCTPDQVILPTEWDWPGAWLVKDATVSEDVARAQEKVEKIAAAATGVCEIKSDGTIQSAHKWAEGEKLDYALIQATVAAMCLDVQGGLIAAVFGLGLGFDTHLFTRHEQLESLIRERAEEFWESVLLDQPPSSRYLDDSEAIGRSLGAIYEEKPGTTIQLDEGWAESVKKYQEAGEKIKELKSQRQAIKNAVCETMKDHTWAEIPGCEKRWQWATEEREPYTVPRRKGRSLRLVNA